MDRALGELPGESQVYHPTNHARYRFVVSMPDSDERPAFTFGTMAARQGLYDKLFSHNTRAREVAANLLNPDDPRQVRETLALESSNLFLHKIEQGRVSLLGAAVMEAATEESGLTVRETVFRDPLRLVVDPLIHTAIAPESDNSTVTLEILQRPSIRQFLAGAELTLKNDKRIVIAPGLQVAAETYQGSVGSVREALEERTPWLKQHSGEQMPNIELQIDSNYKKVRLVSELGESEIDLQPSANKGHPSMEAQRMPRIKAQALKFLGENPGQPFSAEEIAEVLGGGLHGGARESIAAFLTSVELNGQQVISRVVKPGMKAKLWYQSNFAFVGGDYN